MRDVGVVHRMSEIDDFASVFIASGVLADRKDAANFQFFPALFANVHYAAIHRRSQVLTDQRLGLIQLFPRRGTQTRGPLRCFQRLACRPPHGHASPEAAG